MIKPVILALLLLLLGGCSDSPPPKVVLAINPWPGYEILYLASQKGFLAEEGLNIELAQVATLSDAQRAYLSGRVSGFTSTMIEAVQVEALGGKPVKVVLAADYSNGGDVILAHSNLPDVKSLKGKTVGCEVSSLGIYVLNRALAANGMSLDDVKVINVEQGDGGRMLESGEIVAMVSYPPYSFAILKESHSHLIFTTREIPGEILDTISIDADILATQPDFVPRLRRAWQKALDYFQAQPEEAIAMMAQREGISPDEFQAAINDLYLLNTADQQKMFDDVSKLENMARSVCTTLKHIDAVEGDCSHVIGMFDVSGGR
ncbi:ABC transporter substrate-binding protein [Shewanella sp. JM162201]|uniref:ABC transporter substrate-binding protein n=1 Tax=Shewanella jiangmenensis TaxID=2837387 RepID=A0ABS5V6Y4_9GAMM|nr:ABC transporter substrate-binding protein [Shewanella jiangmenensis]MBT1446189.1 ABC transporter substrate-binding protein [Shewanella jiangmenensis]